MKLIKKLLPILILLILGMAGYFGYQLFIVPQMVKLPVPTEIPFYTVSYIYYLKPTSLSSYSFGSEQISASDLGNVVLKDMKDIKSAGFGGIKLGYNFKTNNYIQNRVALKAAQVGLYPIGMLTGDNIKPKERAFDDKEMTEWESFVRDEVRANKNYIYFWEVWNEPSNDMFRYGSAEEYVTLLKHTSSIIKQENPSAKIIATLDFEANTNNNDFSDKVLSLGGNYFDFVSFHPYSANPYLREDAFKAAVNKEEQLLAKYGNKWGLIISEIGQPTSEVSEEEQARLGKIVYQEAIGRNIPLTWLHYSDRRLLEGALIGDGMNWGLIRTDGTPRPLYETIKELIRSNPR
ncbi:hypothetical protein D4R99_02070 [bacterium]|nr:MAG: hypothetical protein D4R99_02070 [bacterium]